MTNNTHTIVVNPLDVERVRKAQSACLRAYKRLGTWRKVGQYFEVPYRYCWELALHGVVPTNKDFRKALGLPKVLPSERKPKVIRDVWRAKLHEGLERIK